jgi:hypothetical protein
MLPTSPRRSRRDCWRGSRARLNGRFYEGVCQATLEFRCSVVQWTVGSLCGSRDVVIHDFVADACWSLTQGASETQGRGYSRRARCSVELLSVPAPGRLPHTKCAQSAGSKPRLPTRPIFADGRSQATRGRVGRVDLQFSRCIVLRYGQQHALPIRRWV